MAIAFVALLVLVLAMPFTGAVRLSFFPDIPGDNVRAQVTMHTDASYGQTHAALRALEATARDIDRELVARSGATGADTGISNLQVLSEADQSGKITVELTPDAPYDLATFTRLWKERAGLPAGVKTLSIASRPDMVDALRVELRANDDELLAAAGAELKAELQRIPAVSGIEDQPPGQPAPAVPETECPGQGPGADHGHAGGTGATGVPGTSGATLPAQQ